MLIILWADNQITEILGLSSLYRLAHFSIADNRIERMSGLDYLPIKFLRLVGYVLEGGEGNK